MAFQFTTMRYEECMRNVLRAYFNESPWELVDVMMNDIEPSTLVEQTQLSNASA
jgi:hypothetical protein